MPKVLRVTIYINKMNTQKNAFSLIFLFGLISLFGDIIYEGVRSITAPFLSSLGATAIIIGFFSGLGEFLTHSLRFFSGYISDRKKIYWLFIILGYGLICSLPFLAWIGSWKIAVSLLLLERIGKAIRTPARDTLISFAGKNLGVGKSFGIHELFDQIGAILGPLIFLFVLSRFKSYSLGFKLMWFPYFLLIIILIAARKQYNIKIEKEIKRRSDFITLEFLLYLIFVFLSLAGLVNFQLISYHLKIKEIVDVSKIPVFYLLAMGIDGIVAFFIGNLYDRIKFKTLILVPVITILISFFSFSKSVIFSIIGVLLLGMVIGFHETVLRAAVADIASAGKRGFAYGIFSSIYGFSIFVSGWIIGFLYEKRFNFIPFYVFSVEFLAFLTLIYIIKKYGVEKAG